MATKEDTDSALSSTSDRVLLAGKICITSNRVERGRKGREGGNQPAAFSTNRRIELISAPWTFKYILSVPPYRMSSGLVLL